MSIDARRWLMTAVGAPFERVGFAATAGAGEVVVAKLHAVAAHGAALTLNSRTLDAGALKSSIAGFAKARPFVETHPLDEINRVFEAVHRRAIKKRAVLVP